jgi:hypothetical protein
VVKADPSLAELIRECQRLHGVAERAIAGAQAVGADYVSASLALRTTLGQIRSEHGRTPNAPAHRRLL